MAAGSHAFANASEIGFRQGGDRLLGRFQQPGFKFG